MGNRECQSGNLSSQFAGDRQGLTFAVWLSLGEGSGPGSVLPIICTMEASQVLILPSAFCGENKISSWLGSSPLACCQEAPLPRLLNYSLPACSGSQVHQLVHCVCIFESLLAVVFFKGLFTLLYYYIYVYIPVWDYVNHVCTGPCLKTTTTRQGRATLLNNQQCSLFKIIAF